MGIVSFGRHPNSYFNKNMRFYRNIMKLDLERNINSNNKN